MAISFDLQQELKDVRIMMELRKREEERRKRFDEEKGSYEFRQDDLKDVSPLEYRKE